MDEIKVKWGEWLPLLLYCAGAVQALDSAELGKFPPSYHWLKSMFSLRCFLEKMLGLGPSWIKGG